MSRFAIACLFLSVFSPAMADEEFEFFSFDPIDRVSSSSQYFCGPNVLNVTINVLVDEQGETTPSIVGTVSYGDQTVRFGDRIVKELATITSYEGELQVQCDHEVGAFHLDFPSARGDEEGSVNATVRPSGKVSVLTSFAVKLDRAYPVE